MFNLSFVASKSITVTMQIVDDSVDLQTIEKMLRNGRAIFDEERGVVVTRNKVIAKLADVPYRNTVSFADMSFDYYSVTGV